MQVMQTRPRFAVQSLLATFFAATALVAGCSSSSSTETSTAPLPDAAQVLQESAASTKAQQSVHLLLTVQGTIDGLPIEKLDGDLTNTPEVAAEGTTDLIAFGQKIEDAKFVVADGNLYAALTPATRCQLRTGREDLRHLGHPEPRHRPRQRAGELQRRQGRRP